MKTSKSPKEMDGEPTKTEQIEPFASDSALSDPIHDRFKRSPFAQRVAGTIASRQDPSCIVIGIYGAWGEGKTTVLNFIQYELRISQDIICVKFNPWRFGDESALIANYFQVLADALNKSLSTKAEEVGERLKKYATFVPLSLTIAGIVGISPGESAKQMGEALSSVDLETLKDRLEELLQKEKKRIVVLMDDIDRLDKIEINNVFKLIKLTADFSYTAYVLAFDNRMVAAALREKYSEDQIDSGESFLEKIIHVPLHLPRADTTALRQLCFEGIDQAFRTSSISLTQEQIDRFTLYFIKGLEIRLKTPRTAKRYSNAISFALPILKDEVNLVDLLLIEGIRVFYPKVYTFVRDNHDLFVRSQEGYVIGKDKKEEKQNLLQQEAWKDLTEKESKALQGLLEELFPAWGTNSYSAGWTVQWTKEKRIASEFYFDRYFSYTVPEGDIPDKTVEGFISQISKNSVTDVATRLKALLSDRNVDNVIRKLRDHEHELTPEESKVLGTAISIIGTSFPNPKVLFSPLTPFTQAAILVAQLSLNIPDREERFSYAKTIILEGEPLSFSMEIARWFGRGKDTPESRQKLTEEQEKNLELKLASRIREFAIKEGPIYISHPEHSRAMLSIWARLFSNDDTNKYLADSFSANPSNAINFIKTYLRTGWSMTSGMPHIHALEREEYDSIERVVDAEIIMEKLRIVYGAEVDQATLSSTDTDEVTDRTIAFRFAALRRHVKGEKAIPSSPEVVSAKVSENGGG